MLNRWLIALAVVSVFPVVLPALADDYEDGQEQLPFGYVRSIDVMAGSRSPVGALELAAEYATSMRNFDQAISLCRRALKITEGDLDVHVAYGQALLGKMSTQAEPDPELYNACVKEWLIVLRTEKGEEAGLNNSKGLGLPYANKLFEDEDHAILAQVRLKQLVGSLPKRGETDDKYLHRVCKPASLEVSGKIIHGKKGPPPPPTLWMK